MRLRPQYLLLFSRLNIGRQNIKANLTLPGCRTSAGSEDIQQVKREISYMLEDMERNKACCFGILSGPSRSTGLISIGLRHVRETSIVKLCVLSPFESRSIILVLGVLRTVYCLCPKFENSIMFVSYMLKSCVWWLFETSEIYPTFLRDAQILTTASVRDSKLHHVCCRYAQIPPIAWV